MTVHVASTMEWTAPDVASQQKAARMAAFLATPDEVVPLHDRSAKAQKREAPTAHVVYFVRASNGTIKIGTTYNLRRRIYGAQFRDTVIIAAVPGSFDLEHALHTKFARYRIPGSEWFWPNTEILEFIANLGRS